MTVGPTKTGRARLGQPADPSSGSPGNTAEPSAVAGGSAADEERPDRWSRRGRSQQPPRNRRGHRSAEATARRIARGQERRAAAEPAATADSSGGTAEAAAVGGSTYSAGAAVSHEAEVPEPAGDGPSAGPTASVEEAGSAAQGERSEPRFVYENPRVRLSAIPVPIPVEEAEQEAAAQLTGGSRFPDQPPLKSEGYLRLQARLRDAQAARAVLDQLPATSSAENLVEEPNWSPSVDTTSSHEWVEEEIEDPAASFVKADPVPESTPDSTLDSTLSKDWGKVSEPPDEVEIALRKSRPASSAGLAAPPLYAAGVSAELE